MVIRLFAQTQNQDEARKLLLDVIEILSEKIKEYSFVKCEPYWKMEGITEVEAKIDFVDELRNDERERFFMSISDKWLYFGNPIEEALASKTTDGCKNLMKGIEMINVIF